LFVFSAKTEKSLTTYLSAFDEYLDDVDEGDHFARDLSYTLGQRRNQHPYRVAIAAEHTEDLQEKLLKAKSSRIKNRTIAFAFTGQGAQHAQMATELKKFKVFSKAIDEAEEGFRSMGARWSLKAELAKPAEESRINVAEISQPACTAIQLALVALLKSWGVSATTVTGHSSGEIAAAFTAGLISFKTALAVAYFRGQAAARLSREQARQGAMLALGIGPEEAAELIQEHAGGYAIIAAINSPSSITVSGDEAAVDNVHKAASAQDIFARKLKIEMAYHSRHMEAVADSYFADIQPFFERDTSAKDAARPAFVSSVTGRTEETTDASYWVKNLVRPVRFADAVKAMFTKQEVSKIKSNQALPNVIVEVGPHGALKGPINQTIESLQLTDKSAFTYLPSLVRGIASDEALVTLAGSLFTMGAQIDLGGVNQTNQNNSHVLSGLPAYSWDNSVRYELRPRPTNEKLFPGEEYHELLGRRAISTSGQERVYRQVFTLDEMPWIRDHVVAGATIFPMTGYMSCAIEACKRTLSSPAEAFLVQNFHVTRSLEIQEEERVELLTKLRPAPLGEGAFSTTAWSFEISSFTAGNGWTRHTYGQIEAEMAPMTMETPTIKASLPLIDTTADIIERDIQATYASAGVRATRYGPSFRNNVRFWEGKGYTILEHRLRDLSHVRPDPRGSIVSVDPQTLDGFLQGGSPLQVDEDGRRPAQMPNHINRFRVSNKIQTTPNTKFDVVMRLLAYDGKGGRMRVGVAAFAEDADGTKHAVAEWENISFRSIGSAEENVDATADVPDHWAWELLPRYDFLPQAELQKMLTAEPLGEDVVQFFRDLDAASTYYMKKALEETKGEDFPNLPSHLAHFLVWAKKTVAGYERKIPEDTTKLLEDVSTHDAQGELLCLIGEKIPAILRGEVQPLEIMLEGGLLSRHYEADMTNAYLSHVLGDLMDNLATVNPNLRILEIGGGTAGTTFPVMECLSRGRDEPGFLTYTFTDISSGFFENAREKLSRWSDRVIYKKCDITQDPLEQGFEAQAYDVVIAANVLHATPDMVKTMTHVRTMLKPGGKLCLLEAGFHPPPVLPFALLPGWWGAEDKYRDHEDGPMMEVEMWDRLLLDVGFSGVDASLTGLEVSPKLMNVICSQRVGLGAQESQAITVCGPFLNDSEVAYAEELANYLSEQMDCPVDARPYTEIDPAEDPLYIFIDSKENSVLQNPSDTQFEEIQTLLLKNRGLLWIIPEGATPDAHIIKGLLRTFRLEQDTKRVLMLDGIPTVTSNAPSILKLANLLRDPEVTRGQESDFHWHNGSIHLPRMRQLKEVKEQFAVERGISYQKTQNLWTGAPLEMTIGAAGSADSIYFRRTTVPLQELADNEVLLQVEAAGVSNRDLDLVLGLIPWAPPGFDGAGTVVKTGSKVSPHIRKGDKVFFLALEQSGFATYKKVPVSHVGLVPTGMTTTSAASIPLAYSLAVLALVETARLKKNETVLIHSAAGALGQACVVLAKSIGARIFATAGTEAKRELLHSTFGIPKNHIFSSRTNTFRDGILCATNGKGMDVIINSLGGELLTATWALAAPFGRFVEVGKKDAFQNNNLNMKPFDKNVTLSAIDIRSLYQHRPEDIQEIFSQVVALLDKKIVVPIEPLTVLPISEFSTALRKIKSGDIAGKVVVTLGKEEEVVAESALLPSPVTLHANATYLVTGGTRGIGLDLAAWMIENGAQNIILLGRSGGNSPSVQNLQKKYEGTSVTIRALACNVGNRDEMAHAVAACSDLPPIRGVIHSALVLSVSLIYTKTY
jgi:NADPH:quinone reductase-like Zn-dependent oxidoreductase/SAM-dependent methyltransferase